MQFKNIGITALLGAAAALPNPSTSLEVRGVTDACANQPAGAGPSPGRKTDALSFQQSRVYSGPSTQAVAPDGYQRTFHVHLASTEVDSIPKHLSLIHI